MKKKSLVQVFVLLVLIIALGGFLLLIFQPLKIPSILPLLLPLIIGLSIISVFVLKNSIKRAGQADAADEERKSCEEELAKSYAEDNAKDNLLELLFNSVPDAILIYTLDDQNIVQKCVEVNEVACTILGYTREELLNILPLELIGSPDLDAVADKIKEIILEKRLVF